MEVHKHIGQTIWDAKPEDKRNSTQHMKLSTKWLCDAAGQACRSSMKESCKTDGECVKMQQT